MQPHHEESDATDRTRLIAYRLVVIAASVGAFFVLFTSLVRATAATGGIVRFLLMFGLLVVGAGELLFAILCGAYLQKAKTKSAAARRTFRLLAYSAAAALVGQLIHLALLVVGRSLLRFLAALDAGDLIPLAVYTTLVVAFALLSVHYDRRRSQPDRGH